jgi:acetoin utilization deacetylase AcuC-like enzyme
VFLEHDTGAHVENASRLVAIEHELERRDLLGNRPEIPFSAASDEALARVHDPRYVAGVRQFAAGGGGWLDAGTTPPRSGGWASASSTPSPSPPPTRSIAVWSGC